MSEKTLKLLVLALVVLLVVSFFVGKKKPAVGDVNVYSQTEAAEGLNLKAVGEIVKEVATAEELEKRLNEQGGINNLDLNSDGKVDYIQVTEYGAENVMGFSLTVEPAEGEEQEVATIEIAKGGEKARVEVAGNPQVYGANQYYHYSSGLTNFLLMAYLFSPHRPWLSPYGYGAYPSSYGYGHSTVPSNRYQGRIGGYVDRSNATRVGSSQLGTEIRSPNAGKIADKGIRAPLRSPTASQKSFQARSTGATGTRSGGFGRSQSSESGPSRPSVRSGGFGRSGGFSGGK